MISKEEQLATNKIGMMDSALVSGLHSTMWQVLCIDFHSLAYHVQYAT